MRDLEKKTEKLPIPRVFKLNQAQVNILKKYYKKLLNAEASLGKTTQIRNDVKRARKQQIAQSTVSKYLQTLTNLMVKTEVGIKRVWQNVGKEVKNIVTIISKILKEWVSISSTASKKERKASRYITVE